MDVKIAIIDRATGKLSHVWTPTDAQPTIPIDGINHRYDEPLEERRLLGLYDFQPVGLLDCPPGKKLQGPIYTEDHAAGVVVESFLLVDMTAGEFKASKNTPILAQIDALEQDALKKGLIRTAIEQLLLLVPAGSSAHAKLLENDQARAALRAALVK